MGISLGSFLQDFYVSFELSSNLWCTDSVRRGQVDHIVLPRKVYYSSQVGRVGAASVKVYVLETDTTIELYE